MTNSCERLAHSEKVNFSYDPKLSGWTLAFGPRVRLGPKSPNERKTLWWRCGCRVSVRAVVQFTAPSWALSIGRAPSQPRLLELESCQPVAHSLQSTERGEFLIKQRPNYTNITKSAFLIQLVCSRLGVPQLSESFVAEQIFLSVGVYFGSMYPQNGVLL